jgi:capsular polysaccharide export protein
LGIEPIVLRYNNNQSRLFPANDVREIYLSTYRKEVKVVSNVPLDVVRNIISIELKRNYSKFNTKQKEARQAWIIKRDFLATKNILQEIKPELLFVWNGYTGNVANVLRFQSSAIHKTFYLERSFFNESLFVDRAGVNGEASIINDNIIEKNLSDIPQEYTAGKEIPLSSASANSSGSDFRDGYIFVPLQVQTDTNNILYSREIKKMRALVLLVLSRVKKINRELSANFKIVVREHPEEVDKNLNLPLDDLLYYRSNGSVQDWMKDAKCVVNINSTVGLEAIYNNLNVISLGTSIYARDDLTLLSSINDFYSKLKDVLEARWKPDGQEVSKYFRYLYKWNTVNCHNFSIDHELVSSSDSLETTDMKLSEIIKNKSKINVGVDLAANCKLNLTYRDIDVAPNAPLYRKLFSKRVGYRGDILFSNYRKDEQANYDIVITGNPDVVSNNHSVVVDPYLVPYFYGDGR